MMRSLYSAISGLGSNQKSMDVIGNNLANVNTTGFKSGRAVFQDMLSQTLVGGKTPTDARGGVNPRQVGLGNYLAAVDNIFSAGTPTTTSKTTDLAIQGDGFFVVRGEGMGEYYYTRAGDFNFDRYGTLVNASGYKVMGWMADPLTGEMRETDEVGDIVVGPAFQTIQAKETSKVSMNAVLNTVANATVVQYPELLHTADQTNSIFSVFSSNGTKLDLAENEPVRIKAHVTDMTNMQYVYNTTDTNLNLQNNKNLMLYINNNPHTLVYGTDFSTMGDLAAAVQNLLNTESAGTDFNVSVEAGELKIIRSTDNGNDIQINSFTGSAQLAAALNSLSGSYNEAGMSRFSDELYYQQTKYAGRDFKNLSELATVIEQGLDGYVIDADQFSVNFNESTGKFSFINTSTNTTLSGFTLDKAYSGTIFENNLSPSGALTVAAGQTGESEKFLRYAKGSDSLISLYTNKGESLGLDETAILQFKSSLGGEETPGIGTIPVLESGTPWLNPGDVGYETPVYSSVDDLRAMMAGHMGFANSTENQVKEHLSDLSETNGKLNVTGEKGVSNTIDFLKFEVVGANDYQNFYNYFDYQTVQNSSGGQMVTTQTIYDKQGNAHTMKYTYTMENSTGNVWKLNLSTVDDKTNVSFNQTGGNEVLLHFNNDGSFNYVATEDGSRVTDLSFNFDPGNGAGVISGIEMFLGTPSMYDGIYISAKESSKNSAEQDGYAIGSLEQLTFSPSGEIVGYYTNGEVMTVAQVALATFTNNQGLLKVGDTLFSETGNSGNAAIGKPQTGSRGEILSGALENSNVELSSEFVNMITTQRGFQANSRVITTSDEMLQELLTLKR
jgi:flagellar hook protein FlgE